VWEWQGAVALHVCSERVWGGVVRGEYVRKAFHRAQKSRGRRSDDPGVCSFNFDLRLARLGELSSGDGVVGNVRLGQAIVGRQLALLDAVQKDHLSE
jgi:hypothetical protein